MHKTEMQLATKAVQSAGAYLESLGTLRVDSLEGKDIKLEADRQSEQRILEALAPSGLSVLTEESGQIGGQAGARWIIDPLDGTYNFYLGLRDLACVSVALWDDDGPVLGVVYQLGRKRLFQGDVAAGEARVDGVACHTSSLVDPGQAALATGFPVYMDFNSDNLSRYITATQHFKKVRMLGAAALMSTFVGAGFVDVYSEKSIKLWDIAAGYAITIAAGGAGRIDDMGDNKCHVALCANTSLLTNSIPLLFQR